AEARAEAIARAGPVLWHAGGTALYRSEDCGVTWHAVLRVDRVEEEEESLEDMATGCSTVSTDGERRVAALCDGRLFSSQDGGTPFAETAAPAGANAIEWQTGRAVARRAPRDRVRREGDWASRFDDEGAWISGDGGATWQELPDAAAYDLIDVI